MKTLLKVCLLLACISTFIFCKKEKEDLSLLTSNEILFTCDSLQFCPNPSGVCEIFKVVEQMPRFFSPDCENLMANNNTKRECADEKMIQFLKDNVVYPKIALDNNIEGEVVIQIVISKDNGCLSSISIVRDIGYNCGIEVQRVVSTMPDFIEGRQRGTPVDVQYNIPYTFEL